MHEVRFECVEHLVEEPNHPYLGREREGVDPVLQRRCVPDARLNKIVEVTPLQEGYQ